MGNGSAIHCPLTILGPRAGNGQWAMEPSPIAHWPPSQQLRAMHEEDRPSLRKSLVSRRLRPAAPSLPMPLLRDAVVAHLAAQGIGSGTVRAHVIALGLGPISVRHVRRIAKANGFPFANNGGHATLPFREVFSLALKVVLVYGPYVGVHVVHRIASHMAPGALSATKSSPTSAPDAHDRS